MHVTKGRLIGCHTGYPDNKGENLHHKIERKKQTNYKLW